MARKKSSSRTTLSYILSLLIAIFLSILVVLTVTRFTVMSPGFLISKMDGADFYKQSVGSIAKIMSFNKCSSRFDTTAITAY